MENILVKCAQCDNLVIINKKDFNCKIFRHGVYKKNNKQIDPHLNKEECDRLFKEGLIYGCGKPFKLLMDEEENKFWTEKCNYI
tara:strand:+ start:86 stop:337 length:252 start_codon:yes stop_codon:yes gene_type:complete